MRQHCLAGVRKPAQRAIVTDAIRSPAQALSPEVRAPMERRFHHDFSHVRVHAGDAASRSASALSAAAFTLGRDVVFCENRYQPHTNAGADLLAHELEHVAHPPPSQGDAVQVLRAPLPDPTPQDTTTVKKADEKKPEEKKKSKAETLTDKIVALLKPMTGFDFKQQWESIAKQLKTPGTNVPKAATSRQALYETALVDELKVLTAEERATMVTSVHDQVVKNITNAGASDVSAEYKSIVAKTGEMFENNEAGYVYAREKLLAKFGTAEAMMAYYKSFEPNNFPDSKVRGHATGVHPNLLEKLKAAKDLLKKKNWLDGVVAEVSEVGGLRVRENRTSKTRELSEHSFGLAIDINAQSNPYFGTDNKSKPTFPAKLVKDLTGTDFSDGAEAPKIREGGTADVMLTEANKLKAASTAFKNIFDSEDCLQEAFVTYLGKNDLKLTDEQAPQFFTTVKAQKQKDVAAWLSLAKLGPAKEAPPVPAETAPAKPATKGATPTKAAKPPKPPKAPEWEKAKTIATFLISTYGVYRQSRTKKGKEEVKIPETVTGSPAVAAAHGFVNLSGELIAALTANDGGNLNWLGASHSEVKDFHHFELKQSDQPVITKAVPKKADEKKADDAAAPKTK